MVIKGVAVKDPIFAKFVIVVKLEHAWNIPFILVTSDNWAAPGKTQVLRLLQLLKHWLNVVTAPTVFGKVILEINLQLLNVPLKLLHADIEVGKVTDVSDLQVLKQFVIVVTAFKLEGKVTLNKEKHVINVWLSVFNKFIDEGIVILVNK